MNKKLTDLFVGYGLDITENHAYGILEGFETNVEYKGQAFITLSFYATEETKAQIANDLKGLKLPFFKFSVVQTGLVLSKGDWTLNGFIKNFPTFIETILQVLKKYNVLGSTYCPICGEELDVTTSKKYKLGNAFVTLDEKCVEDINHSIEEENKAFDDAPNNYLRGTLGAFVGAIVGVISLVILFFIGIVSSLSAIVGIALGTFLYKHFGGKPTKVMFVIVTAINLVALLLAVFILYYRVAGILAPDYGFSSTGMAAFNDMMTVSDFSSEFIQNLLMTAFFSVLGTVVCGLIMFKTLKRDKPIK